MSTNNESEKLETVAAFVHELMRLRADESILHVCTSNSSVFRAIPFHSTKRLSGPDWNSEISANEKFDFVLGEFPLGMRNKIECDIGSKILKVRSNWAEIVRSVNLLSDEGLAVFIVEPTGFSSPEGKKLEVALNSEGYFVNAIINAPDGLLRPESNITPVLVLISKRETSTIFISELLSEPQAVQVTRNYFFRKVSTELNQGLSIEPMSFHGFHRLKIKRQIERLETQYKEFKEYTIGEIAQEINCAKLGDSHVEKNNSVYMPKAGNLPVVSSLSDITTKHHNYFQVVIGPQAINGYVAAFFRTHLGKLALQAQVSGTVINHLYKSDLMQVTIALPSIDVQEQIMKTHQKLRDLQQVIEKFDSELALSPTSSQSILVQLDSMLGAIGSLTEADEIRNISRQGESKCIEFKETFSLDVKKQTKEKYIEISALKTIVAFLNTEGGVLLVGVSDDGNIRGLDSELDKFYKGNTDKFLLHFKNSLKTRIGEEFYPYIEYNLVLVDQKRVLIVKCEESRTPCYLDNAEFYVRTNPATDKLEGPKLVQYVKNHFDG